MADDPNSHTSVLRTSRQTITARVATLLSPRSETWLVIGLPVLLFGALGAIRSDVESHALTTARLLDTVLLEALIVVLLVPILHARGWTLAKVTRPIRSTDLLHAIGLLLVAYAGVVLLGLGLSLVATRTQVAYGLTSRIAVTASPLAIILVSALNPLFEEFYLVAYTVTALDAWGAIGAVLFSVALRLFFHLYQGAYGLIGIVPFAVALTVYYRRTRTIWPLVIAHIVQDLLGLFLSRAS